MLTLQNTFLEIKNEIIEIENPSVFGWNEVFLEIQNKIQDKKNKYIIKLNLVKTTKDKLYFNVISVEGLKVNYSAFHSLGVAPEGRRPDQGTMCRRSGGYLQATGPAVNGTNIKSDISCLIIPTGIGAAFGGYAGDANPLAKLLASQSDYLLTHPNVVNGAVLSDLPSNLIYLEGFFLDQFLLGNVNIIPNNKNKIGVIFDKGISEERLEYEVNVLNALRAFYGCEIISWTVTDKPLIVIPEVNKFGFSSGKVQNIESITNSAIKLKDLGATAIAICCAIPDLELNSDYISGSGIDPIGGIESVISRSVSAFTGFVSAHAPVLISNEKVDYKKLSPLSAAEYIALTFLPSVISGLRFAPEIVFKDTKNTLSFQNLSNIIVPYNAFGSPGVLYMNEVFKNVVLVEENKTCLEVNSKHLNIDFKVVKKYVNLIDLKMVEESGIDPDVFKRPLNKINRIS